MNSMLKTGKIYNHLILGIFGFASLLIFSCGGENVTRSRVCTGIRRWHTICFV